MKLYLVTLMILSLFGCTAFSPKVEIEHDMPFNTSLYRMTDFKRTRASIGAYLTARLLTQVSIIQEVSAT